METNLPMVSIIIPVYNGADYMRQAIDSALAQSYENTEVIVVNDGSNDGGETASIARSYGDRIRYIEKENGGVATAFNTGIAAMQGTYFSWLSHDDIYKTDKVKAQMQVFEELPFDTIVYGGYELFYDDDTDHTIPVLFEKRYSAQDLNRSLFPVFRGLANGCTILFHKSHFDRAGLFDPALRTTQDYDLWFRLFRGAKVRYQDTSNVLMRQHKEQGSKVIPGHLVEANALWIRMCDGLTDFERTELSGTPLLFYRSLTDFLEESPYREAERHVRMRAEEEEAKRKEETDDHEKKLRFYLMEQVENLSDRTRALEQELQDARATLPGGRNETPARKTAVFSRENFRYAWIMLKKEGLRSTIRQFFQVLRRGG